MRVTEKMVIQGMMADIQSHLSDISGLQQQISTGRRIQRVSDDPVGAAKSIDLKSTISSLQQYRKNADEASASLSNTLSRLGSVRELMSEAKRLALQGGTDSLTPEAREVSAQAIDRLSARLRDIANSRWNGQYIFSGQKTSTPPFSGAGVYQGDQGAIRRAIGPNETVQVAYDGQTVFKDDVDLFAVLESLQTAFSSNDVGGISAQLEPLDDALDKILSLEAVMGGDSQRVDSAVSRLEDSEATLTELKAKNEDIDLADTIVRLQSLQNTYQAALQSGSQVLQQSLLRLLR